MSYAPSTVSWVSLAGVLGVPHAGRGAMELGSPHLLVAYADVLPIAIILGAGALVWLLGNRKPRLQPVRSPGRRAPQRAPKDRYERETR